MNFLGLFTGGIKTKEKTGLEGVLSLLKSCSPDEISRIKMKIASDGETENQKNLTINEALARLPVYSPRFANMGPTPYEVTTYEDGRVHIEAVSYSGILLITENRLSLDYRLLPQGDRL